MTTQVRRCHIPEAVSDPDVVQRCKIVRHAEGAGAQWKTRLPFPRYGMHLATFHRYFTYLFVEATWKLGNIQ
jgi:hypothetical protein